MASVALPWADTPLALIPTPQFQTNKTDIFTTGATHMCLLHNAIFRGYNSIVNQAAVIEDGQDMADFIGYCLTWYKFVKSHHDDEEAVLFPTVARLLDDDAVFTETHAEHEAFLPGLAAFHDYLAHELDSAPLDFDGERLLALMADFQKPFEHHFRSEVATIAALADHPHAPAAGSPQEAEASALFKSWGKATVSKAGTLDVVPFFLLNLDRSTGPAAFEEGRWASWPPMPAPVRWGLVNIAGAWNSGWWQFTSCDSAGQPQTLYALRGGSSGGGNVEKEDL
ncbi:hypothetical protein SCUCBS95973_007781 [Sporothrix curviconia]|uniref:Hemerythrin-like domain-containing protein n=1 Tax=Sporothrix curviconia TaxID=1260050 RepID=A0ABP0CG63_9PEZI